MKTLLFLCCAGLAGCTPPLSTSGEAFGDVHTGSYHLGPVDWAETQWTNSCSPYPASVQALEGGALAGVDRSLNGDGSLCDACALVKTRLGRSVLVRIVTTGVSNAPGDVDLSQPAFDAIHEVDAHGTPLNPRPMQWQLAKCPSPGAIHLQFQTQANVDWTSFWVRNARLPLARVEVQSTRHAAFTALRRERDGSWNDDRGFGASAFTLRFVSTSGESLTQRLDSFSAGAVVATTQQFQ